MPKRWMWLRSHISDSVRKCSKEVQRFFPCQVYTKHRGDRRNTWPGSIKDSLGLYPNPGIYRALDLILSGARWWIRPCYGGCCDVCTIYSREELCVCFSFCCVCFVYFVSFLFYHAFASTAVVSLSFFPSFPFPTVSFHLSLYTRIYRTSLPHLTFSTSLREI